MLMNSTPFRNAYKSDDRLIHARVTIGDRVFTKDSLKSFSFDSGTYIGDTFGVGTAYANTVKIVFSEIIEDIKELDEIYVEVGIERTLPENLKNRAVKNRIGKARIGQTPLNKWNAHEDIEYASLGKFYLSERADIDRNENKTSIECMDALLFTEKIYESKLNYPAPLKAVATEICNQAGIVADGMSFSKLGNILVDKIEGVSCRIALTYLAQIEGKSVYINRVGALEFKSLTDVDYTIPTSEYFSKGLTKNDFRYRVGGITCKVDSGSESTELTAGDKKGTQIVLENKIMTQGLLNSLYQKIKDTSFYPYSLNWRGNPSLETGDMVSVFDLKGNRYLVPNLSFKLDFTGGLKATSSADTKSQPSSIVASNRPTLDQRFTSINENIQIEKENLIDIINKTIDTSAFDREELINKIEYTKNEIGYQVDEANEQWDLDFEKKREEISKEIEAETEGTAILNKLMVDDLLVEKLYADNAFVTNFNAKTVTAITANITDIRAEMLTSNVIEAEMIQSSQALFDKVFADEAYFEQVAANKAFIESLEVQKLKGLEIYAGKISGPNFDINGAGGYVSTSERFVGSGGKNITGTTKLHKGVLELSTDDGFFDDRILAGRGDIQFISLYKSTNEKLSTSKYGAGGFKYKNDRINQATNFNMREDGLEILPDELNTGAFRNAKLKLSGRDRATLDFSSSVSFSKDYGARIVLDPATTTLDALSIITDKLVLRSDDNVNVRNRADTAWVSMRGAAYINASSRDDKHNIVKLSDYRIEDFMNLNFYSYTRNGTGEYQEGLILEEVTDLPFADELGIDQYSYTTYVSKILQDTIKIDMVRDIIIDDHEERLSLLEKVLEELE